MFLWKAMFKWKPTVLASACERLCFLGKARRQLLIVWFWRKIAAAEPSTVPGFGATICPAPPNAPFHPSRALSQSAPSPWWLFSRMPEM